jgi:hypothetical protein
LLLAATILLIGSPAAIAQGIGPVDVAELLENAAEFTGEITVVGELIGDYGFRSDGSMWTQLNDDSYARAPLLGDGALTGANVGVAVRIPSAIAKQLDPPGGYRIRGPVVAVSGTWNYHDPDRGGESYVDAISLIVIEPGNDLVEHPNYFVLVAGGLLVLGALVLRRGNRRSRE